MSYNAKNYTEQGGDKTVIGGTLDIKEGAILLGFPTPQLAVATETNLGGVKAATKTETDTVPAKIGEDSNLYVPAYPVLPEIPVAANQVASTAEDVTGLLADFNALLAKLKASGLMEADTQG